MPSAALLGALERLLRPLVRLLIHFHVSYPNLCALLKSVYIEVAEQDFQIDRRRQSDSRITLLTGIHRKDVKRLRQGPAPASPAPKTATLGALLVSRWIGLKEYLDEEGRPRGLPRTAREGATPSFEGLVASVSKDIRARVVLDEWLRLGVARVDETDRVWLNTEAFVPEHGFDEKAFFLGRNLHDHIAACTHNLCGGDPPMMERSVFYDRLSERGIRELEHYAKQLGMQALQALNRKAIVLQRAGAADADTKAGRINFGIYFYHDFDAQQTTETPGGDGGDAIRQQKGGDP